MIFPHKYQIAMYNDESELWTGMFDGFQTPDINNVACACRFNLHSYVMCALQKRWLLNFIWQSFKMGHCSSRCGLQLGIRFPHYSFMAFCVRPVAASCACLFKTCVCTHANRGLLVLKKVLFLWRAGVVGGQMLIFKPDVYRHCTCSHFQHTYIKSLCRYAWF